MHLCVLSFSAPPATFCLGWSLGVAALNLGSTSGLEWGPAFCCHSRTFHHLLQKPHGPSCRWPSSCLPRTSCCHHLLKRLSQGPVLTVSLLPSSLSSLSTTYGTTMRPSRDPLTLGDLSSSLKWALLWPRELFTSSSMSSTSCQRPAPWLAPLASTLAGIYPGTCWSIF